MAGRMNELDAFERSLKDRLDQYEVPYNSADWAQMERALASGVRGWGHGRALIVGLLLAGGLLIGGTAYFLGRDVSTKDLAGGTPPTMEHPILPAPTSPIQAVSTLVAASSDTENADVPALPEPTAATITTRSGSDRPTTVQPASVPAPVLLSTSTAATSEPSSNKPSEGNAGTIFRASAKEACPGSPVDFTVDHMPGDGIYLWNFGDGSFSNKPNPQHTFNKPGSYQVMLSMSSSGAGTIHNKPSSDMIVIHDAPMAKFNVLPQIYKGQIPSMHFENRSLGAKSYRWDLGDGTISTLPHPDHVYKVKGVYQVELTVTNAIGCVDRKMNEVRVENDFNLGAPASFSPNKDGKEDSFMPQALLDLTAKFQLAIYDPAGTLVYSTNDPTHPWYGKVKNQGPMCAVGDYVWVVDVESGSQASETFTGKVELLP